MLYEFKLKSRKLALADLSLVHDNPGSAWAVYMALSERFESEDFVILKDEKEISAADLASDLESESYEIEAIIKEEAERLPPTYRSGWGERIEDGDLTIGIEGRPTSVEKKKNPEDRYD